VESTDTPIQEMAQKAKKMERKAASHPVRKPARKGNEKAAPKAQMIQATAQKMVLAKLMEVTIRWKI